MPVSFPSTTQRERYGCYPDSLSGEELAQALGFTLDGVGVMLTLDSTRGRSGTRTLAARKQTLIEQKMADLEAMNQALDALIQQCNAGGSMRQCPIIDVLDPD